MTTSLIEQNTQARITESDWQEATDSTTFPSEAMLTEFPSEAMLTESHKPKPQLVLYRGNIPLVAIGSAGDAPGWLKPVAERLRDLLELPEDWDSYGALQVDPNHVAAALHLMYSIMRDDTPNPAIVPTNRGHIQLEWHQGTMDLEIETLSKNRYLAWFEDSAINTEWEKEIFSDLTELEQHISLFSRQP